MSGMDRLTDEALERLAAFQQDGRFEYEPNDNYASRKGSPIQGHVIRYNPNPRKNSDGSTSYGFNFPALVASDLLGKADETMAEVAEQLNACPAMARELLAHRRASQAAPAPSDGLRGDVAFRRAVLDWIKEDAPIGIKMQMTPDLANKLSDRIAHRRASQAAPAPSDRLVSVGKASGMVEARVSLAARQIRQTLRDYGHRCAETSLPDLIAADVDAALRKQDELHVPAPAQEEPENHD